MRRAALLVPLLGGCLLEFDPALMPEGGPTGCFEETPANASTFAQKGSELGPREWKEIITDGFDTDLLKVAEARTVLDIGDSAVWDPVTREVHIVGGEVARHVSYDERDNAWRIEPEPPFVDAQANDATAFDPASGTLYFRPLDDWTVHTYSTRTAEWSTLPPFQEMAGCCGGLVYFPDAETLVYFDGVWGARHFNFEFSRWEAIEGDYPAGDLVNFAEYSPVHRLVLFGGGEDSTAVYILEPDLTVRVAADAPTSVSAYIANVTADPVSGDFIAIVDPGSMFAYDPLEDRWTELDDTPVIPRTGYGSASQVVSTPIDTHCVIGYFAYDEDESSVWLYRHE